MENYQKREHVQYMKKKVKKFSFGHNAFKDKLKELFELSGCTLEGYYKKTIRYRFKMLVCFLKGITSPYMTLKINFFLISH